ncbi:MAG: 50S ribosomal protein L31 [Gammaproteobacteria bacterium RIFCSPHIGHO2_12_FULL_45_9]|nr:MAG: 50S ribosomal protein L31 [Gammaproteobacteria bacterium RIFCSPHIGHO2_12_FULL_45_9]
MKKEIHPAYETVAVNCSCGHKFEIRSTRTQPLHLDICSKCHPFYTGKQKTMDTGGAISNFRKRFGNRTAYKTQ